MIAAKRQQLRKRWGSVLRERLEAMPWLRWLIAGAVIRLIVMPTTMHNDAVWMPWMAHRIVEGHWNVYQHLSDTYGERTLHPVVWAPYLPLYYFLTAAWTGFLKLFGIIDVGQWWWDTQWHIPLYNRSLLLVKALYLPFDLVTGWALGQLVVPERRPVVWALWSLSPITLHSVYMMGQNDLMATTFVVLATWAGVRACAVAPPAEHRRQWWCDATALFLGIGAAIKYYPLLLVAPFALILCARTGALVRFLVLGWLPLVVTATPFLGSAAFRFGVLLNPEAQQALRTIPGVGHFGLSPFVLAYALILGFLWYRRGNVLDSPALLPVTALVTIGSLLCLGNWVFNWMVWLAPFIVWSVAVAPATSAHAVVYTAIFLIYTWQWGAALSSGLFQPIFPTPLAVPPMKAVLGRLYPWEQLLAVTQSIFVGSLVVHAVVLLRPLSANGTINRPLVGALLILALFVGWVVASVLPAIVQV